MPLKFNPTLHIVFFSVNYNHMHFSGHLSLVVSHTIMATYREQKKRLVIEETMDFLWIFHTRINFKTIITL